MLRLPEHAGHRDHGQGRGDEADQSEPLQRLLPGVGLRRRIERSAPLDKSRTMSDWNQRPLEAKEVYYAALDAYATRAVAVECMHMVLGEASAIPIKERIKAFENEKGRTMERKMDEKEEDFEKRKENTVRDILRFGILASEADQNKYSTICSGFEL